VDSGRTYLLEALEIARNLRQGYFPGSRDHRWACEIERLISDILKTNITKDYQLDKNELNYAQQKLQESFEVKK